MSSKTPAGGVLLSHAHRFVVVARLAAQRLGNAVLLTHDGYGHTSQRDPSTCVTQATSRYLVNLTTPPPGTVCRSDRLPFDPDFGQPAP